ncbi:MAG: ABC transporter ATP-binding protein, partial [Bacteroidales bacterium]|nr:ABC transporter ATP-binding protein [Bacteroidales bacterium]
SYEILSLFQNLHRQGRTIVFVTHNPEIAQFSSRNIVLKDGHVIEDTRQNDIRSAADVLARLPKEED